jgi:hypothetical protein
MADSAIQVSQFKFLRAGGMYELPLQIMRDKGELPPEGSYVFQEYPKHIEVDGRVIEVSSEEEEDRVYAGGMTSAQIEDERLALQQRCRNLHITFDPQWTIVRLKRELGDKLDEPEPADNMAKLEAELASLKKMAAMQAEIEALRAQLSAKPDDREEMIAQLSAHGIKADGRWSLARLREELDRVGAEV